MCLFLLHSGLFLMVIYKVILLRINQLQKLQYSTLFKLYKSQHDVVDGELAVKYSTLFKLYKPQRRVVIIYLYC